MISRISLPLLAILAAVALPLQAQTHRCPGRSTSSVIEENHRMQQITGSAAAPHSPRGGSRW